MGDICKHKHLFSTLRNSLFHKLYLNFMKNKTILGWRTCAIIEDLETEIEIANNPVTKFKVNWSNTLQGLLDTYQG